jgi:hypothetical protein
MIVRDRPQHLSPPGRLNVPPAISGLEHKMIPVCHVGPTSARLSARIEKILANCSSFTSLRKVLPHAPVRPDPPHQDWTSPQTRDGL